MPIPSEIRHRQHLEALERRLARYIARPRKTYANPRTAKRVRTRRRNTIALALRTLKAWRRWHTENPYVVTLSEEETAVVERWTEGEPYQSGGRLTPNPPGPVPGEP